LRGLNSGLQAGNRGQRQENDALRKRHRESFGRSAQPQLGSGDAFKRILQKYETLQKPHHAPNPLKEFPFNDRERYERTASFGN
jgi:hypothetical protein